MNSRILSFYPCNKYNWKIIMVFFTLKQQKSFRGVLTCLPIIGLFSANASSSLTATTAQYIIGNEPQILEATLDKIKNSIYFKITDIIGFSYDYSPGQVSNINLPLNSQFNLVDPKLAQITLSGSDITDDDGDLLSTSNSYSVSNLSYVWKDKNNTIISNNSSNNLGGDICTDSSSYNGPYSLNISFDFTAYTQYGVPNSTTTSITKGYTVNANDGICYIQPGNLALNIPSGWPEGGNNAAAGSNGINRSPAFDSSVFVQSKGFKAWVGKKFPTTAFPDARFQIVPYNSVSGYTVSLEQNPNSALADQQTYAKGQFKFTTSTPDQSQPYVLKVVNNTTSVPYYYSFKLGSSRSWFTPTSTPSTTQTVASALSTCKTSGADLPTRAELTNSIYANDSSTISMGAYAANNGYSRAIGDSLTAEWGKIFYYAPSDGNRRDMVATVPASAISRYFNYSYYWSKDIPNSSVSKTTTYIVGAVEGNVQTRSTTGGSYVLCVQ